MGPRPEELEQDLTFARDQLRRDVDRLLARVSPGTVAHRQTDRMAQRAQQASRAFLPLVRTGRDQVLSRPALLVAGLGLAALSLATVVWRVRSRH